MYEGLSNILPTDNSGHTTHTTHILVHSLSLPLERFHGGPISLTQPDERSTGLNTQSLLPHPTPIVTSVATPIKRRIHLDNASSSPFRCYIPARVYDMCVGYSVVQKIHCAVVARKAKTAKPPSKGGKLDKFPSCIRILCLALRTRIADVGPPTINHGTEKARQELCGRRRPTTGH